MTQRRGAGRLQEEADSGRMMVTPSKPKEQWNGQQKPTTATQLCAEGHLPSPPRPFRATHQDSRADLPPIALQTAPLPSPAFLSPLAVAFFSSGVGFPPGVGSEGNDPPCTYPPAFPQVVTGGELALPSWTWGCFSPQTIKTLCYLVSGKWLLTAELQKHCPGLVLVRSADPHLPPPRRRCGEAPHQHTHLYLPCRSHILPLLGWTWWKKVFFLTHLKLFGRDIEIIHMTLIFPI